MKIPTQDPLDAAVDRLHRERAHATAHQLVLIDSMLTIARVVREERQRREPGLAPFDLVTQPWQRGG